MKYVDFHGVLLPAVFCHYGMGSSACGLVGGASFLEGLGCGINVQLLRETNVADSVQVLIFKERREAGMSGNASPMWSHSLEVFFQPVGAKCLSSSGRLVLKMYATASRNVCACTSVKYISS